MASQPKPPPPSEVALNEAQGLLQMWLRTKAFLAKGLTEDPITREEEQNFLDMKSEIAKYVRVVGQKMPKDVNFGGDKMQELLRQSISIGHLRSLPKADKQMLMGNWHSVFIYLCRAVGTLQFINEGYVPSQKVKSGGGTNLSDLKKGASNAVEVKSGMGKKILIAVVVIIVAAVVYMMFFAE